MWNSAHERDGDVPKHDVAVHMRLWSICGCGGCEEKREGCACSRAQSRTFHSGLESVYSEHVTPEEFGLLNYILGSNSLNAMG